MNDRLPEQGELVLVHIPVPFPFRMNDRLITAGADLAMQMGGDWYFESVGDEPHPEVRVTHWMPLPGPPIADDERAAIEYERVLSTYGIDWAPQNHRRRISR